MEGKKFIRKKPRFLRADWHVPDRFAVRSLRCQIALLPDCDYSVNEMGRFG